MPLTNILPRLRLFTEHLTKFPRTYATVTKMVDQSTWKLNHTMIRVKDPQKSIDYYKLLGLSLIRKFPNPEAKFDLYFLGAGLNLER